MQKKFVEEYMQEPNAEKAALRAGYKSRTSGHALLTQPNIAQEIEARTKPNCPWRFY